MTAATTKDKKNAKQETIENLTRLVRGKTPCVVTPTEEVWVRLPLRDGSHKVVRLRSDRAISWMHAHYNMEYGGVASRQDIEAVLATQEGILLDDPYDRRDIYTRLAPIKQRWPVERTVGFWLDLGRGSKAVKVTADGWKVEGEPEGGIYFRREPGTLPLPEPEPGGSLAELRGFLNCPTGLPDEKEQAQSDQNWQAMLAWEIGTLMPRIGSYPHLLFVSGHGTGKSTNARMLRDLVDPNEALLHREPETPLDVLRKASKSHIVGFDNVTHLTQKVSDTLCQLSTGLTSSERKFYTNDDEIIYNVRGPAILNGLNDIVRYDDLAERTLRVRLPHISRAQRKMEMKLYPDFLAARPRILGALLDAAVAALKHLEDAAESLEALPRHADFAVWLAAAEYALEADPALHWERGTFTKLLEQNWKEMRELALRNNAVVEVLRHFLLDTPIAADDAHHWMGEMGHLLAELGLRARQDEGIALNNPTIGWPATPQRFYEVLRRGQADLADHGLTWTDSERSGHGGKRIRHFIYRPPEEQPAQPEQQTTRRAA